MADMKGTLAGMMGKGNLAPFYGKGKKKKKFVKAGFAKAGSDREVPPAQEKAGAGKKKSTAGKKPAFLFGKK